MIQIKIYIQLNNGRNEFFSTDVMSYGFDSSRAVYWVVTGGKVGATYYFPIVNIVSIKVCNE